AASRRWACWARRAGARRGAGGCSPPRTAPRSSCSTTRAAWRAWPWPQATKGPSSTASASTSRTEGRGAGSAPGRLVHVALLDPLDVVGVEHGRRALDALLAQAGLAAVAPALGLVERLRRGVVHAEVAVVVDHGEGDDHGTSSDERAQHAEHD